MCMRVRERRGRGSEKEQERGLDAEKERNREREKGKGRERMRERAERGGSEAKIERMSGCSSSKRREDRWRDMDSEGELLIW